MKTFSENHFENGLIVELNEDGFTCPIGGFGWPQQVFDAFIEWPVTSKLPITTAIRNNAIVRFQNGEELLALEFPDLAWAPSEGWVTGIAIPVYPIGGMVFMSSQLIELSHQQKIVFTAIGSLLGLYASRLPTELVHQAVKVSEKIHLEQVPLTDRQLVIAGLLERGFSNAEIGLEIGYSESLIRKETVAIYKKLNVTGREAMQLIRTLNLENLKI
jgi:DNA-binding CsgD family transcriptional regulator